MQKMMNAQCTANLWGVIIGVSLIVIVILVQIFQSTEYIKQMCFSKHPHVIMKPRGTLIYYELDVLTSCYIFDKFPSYEIIGLIENEKEALEKLNLYYRKDIVIK